MKRWLLTSFVMMGLTASGWAQASPAPAADPWQSLQFLEGTWSVTSTHGPQGAPVSETGSYSFRTELDGHILARHGHVDSCKAVNSFDCDHGDLLYIYRDLPGAPLKAIFFDNEGHTIHYDVTTPTPTSVEFLSDASQRGPRFRLSYELKNGLMTGRFQMQMPGQTDWHSYLEWSGPKA